MIPLHVVHNVCVLAQEPQATIYHVSRRYIRGTATVARYIIVDALEIHASI